MVLRWGRLLVWVLLLQISSAQAAETTIAAPGAAPVTAIDSTASSTAASTVTATAVPAAVAHIALIIDDLGYSLRQGRRAIDLPGAVTCSILPGAPHAQQLAQQAKDAGKEIMLHLPMQGSVHKIEPDSLSGEMTEADFREILRRQLAAMPGAVG